MVRPHGYITVVSDAPQVMERDTITCGHCQRVVIVKPCTVATVYLVQDRHGRWHEEPGAACRMCMRPVCLSCEAAGVCTPFEKALEQMEARRI